MQNWRYFGRTGATSEIFEIYRIPANGKSFSSQSREVVERLCRDGKWRSGNNEGIWREVFLGGFSERDDEISEEEVNRLFQEWSAGKWPGLY